MLVWATLLQLQLAIVAGGAATGASTAAGDAGGGAKKLKAKVGSIVERHDHGGVYTDSFTAALVRPHAVVHVAVTPVKHYNHPAHALIDTLDDEETDWRRCDVEHYGAVAGDGLPDTVAIRAALAACGGPRGGEIMLRGPGAYDSLPMNLTSNQVLHVATGATLRAPLVNSSRHCIDAKSPCPYAVMDRFPSYQSSRSGFGCRLGPFVGAYKQSNISITGGGTIDGQGTWFYDNMKSLKIERPRLVELQFVQGLKIGPIKLHNSPYWTLHPIYCRDVHIHDISITSVWEGSRSGWGFNTDGIDPDSSSDVLIENYVYDAGDDAIAVKSGWNYAGSSILLLFWVQKMAPQIWGVFQ